MHCTTSNKPLLSILQVFNHFSLLELWLMLIVRIKTSYCSERIIKSIMWIKLLSNSASWSLFGFTSVHQFMGRTHSTFKESKNCIKTSLKLIAVLCIEIELQCEYAHWALIFDYFWYPFKNNIILYLQPLLHTGCTCRIHLLFFKMMCNT